MCNPTKRFVSMVATMIVYIGGISSGYAQTAGHPTMKEASGIAVLGDFEAGGQFIIVDDEEPGGYFACKKADATNQRTNYTRALVAKYEFTNCDFVHVNRASLATDLESVEILGKDDFILLSESLRALIRTDATATTGKGALVAQYYSPFSEIGGRGLEGVAIKPDGSGKYRVAVVWEGGYPETKRLPVGLKGGNLPQLAMEPVVIRSVSSLAKNGEEVRSLGPDISSLKVPKVLVNEPAGQRFRATDLVWKTLDTENEDIIVLISSHDGIEPPSNKFKYACLMEFDNNGHPLGTSLDLKQALRDDKEQKLAEEANWEGLGWYDESSLVLVNDSAAPGVPPPPTTALIIKWPPPAGSPECQVSP